jgi:hypothetical protein
MQAESTPLPGIRPPWTGVNVGVISRKVSLMAKMLMSGLMHARIWFQGGRREKLQRRQIQ